MKTNFTRYVFILLLFFISNNIFAQHPFDGGSGTPEDPFQIATASQLNAIRGEYLDDHFIQTADIDLSGYSDGVGWEPIGNCNYPPGNPFTGNYDGGNHSISNLTINDKGESQKIGLFGFIEVASIMNVNLVDVSVNTIFCDYTGALVGESSNSFIFGCKVINGSISGITYTGVLIGFSESDNIVQCSSSDVSVTGNDETGGVVGSADYSTFEDCYSRSSVNGGNGETAGGFAGKATGSTITNVYAAGVVTGFASLTCADIGSSIANIIDGLIFDEDINPNVPGRGEGKSTPQMQEPMTSILAGYQPAVWSFDPNVNESYPHLRWENPDSKPLNEALRITVEQVNDNTVTPPVDFSTKGIIDFTYVPDDNPCYFNAYAERNSITVWIVQNDYIPDNSTTENEQEISFRFDLSDLGVTPGEGINSLGISTWISSSPITTQPAGLTFPSRPVTSLLEDDGGEMPLPPGFQAPLFINLLPEEFTELDIIDQEAYRSMPEIDLDNSSHPAIPGGYAGDEDACGPAVAAQNTKWLSDSDPHIDIPDDTRTIMTDFSSNMDRSSPVSPENFILGILDYIDEKGVSVGVKFQSISLSSDVSGTSGGNSAINENTGDYPSWEWLKEKVFGCQAVGILYYYPVGEAWGGHYAAVSGLEESVDGRKHIKFKHDLNQSGSGGTKQEDDRIYIDENGCMLLEKRGAFIGTVVSQYQSTDFNQDGQLTVRNLGIGSASDHSIFIDANGLVYTFGRNSYGQLGDGLTTNCLTPVKAVKGVYNGSTNLGDNPDNKIIAVAGGSSHSIALAEDGMVYTWGKNNYGQLGDGTNSQQTTPVKVLCGEYGNGTATYLGDNPGNKIISVAAGNDFSIALAQDGTVYTWGYNEYGKLGNNSTTSSSSPVKVLLGEYTGTEFLGDNSANKIIAIALGYFHSLALAEDGTVYTWGRNNYGQLGNATYVDSYTPVKVKNGAYSGSEFLGDNAANKIISVALGYHHNIALAEDGNVFTWGRNNNGQLGDNTGIIRTTPVKVLKGEYSGTTFLGDNSGNKISAVALGAYHSIALAEDGSVFSWGSNTGGKLGNGLTYPCSTPVRVLKGEYNGNNCLGDNLSYRVTAIALGNNHSIALVEDGSVYTWGVNTYGQLGDNTTSSCLTPIKVHGESNEGNLLLPVELTSFSAASASSASTGSATAVVLNWTTATEVNNYGFEVERSLVIGRQSLENWEVIGFVEGHGNSNSPKSYEFVDANPPAGSLKYRLKQIDTDGKYEYYGTIAEINFNPTGTEEPATAGLPTEFALLQNYPNPFNPATTIAYSIPSSLVVTHVSLIVYNPLGQQVATLVNEQKAPGRYKVKFDGSKLSSGMYLYRLQAGKFVQTRKLILIK